MQKKLVPTLFCATGLMLTTAFSSVYGMEEQKEAREGSPRAHLLFIQANKSKKLRLQVCLHLKSLINFNIF